MREDAVRAGATVTAALAGLLWCAPAPAQSPALSDAPAVQPLELPNTVEAYERVFDAWAHRREPKTAILVIRHNGKTAFMKGVNTDPDKPILIASLSKAITGACIATLIRDGKLAFTMPMRTALARYFEKYGRPADPRFEDVTVEQLLLHRAGLSGNPDGDPMHAIWRARIAQGLGRSPAPQPLLAEHLKLRLIRAPGARESYSNTGYLALTVVIEEISGKPYEDYCRESVLMPLDIDARLHPDWATYSGSGGWLISGADYLKFLDIFDMDNPFLGDEVKAWIDRGHARGGDPNDWYSLGVGTSIRHGRRAVSHLGLLHSRGKDPEGRAIAANISSAGTRNFDGVGTFIAMTPPRGANRAIRDLRTQLGRAHQAVKVWP